MIVAALLIAVAGSLFLAVVLIPVLVERDQPKAPRLCPECGQPWNGAALAGSVDEYARTGRTYVEGEGFCHTCGGLLF